MNIGALHLCRNVECCCFTTESSCSTSILTSRYLDGLIKDRSQDATAGKLHASYAVHEEDKGRHIYQNHHTTYRIPTFSQTLDKSIEEILTNKNVKEQTLEKDIVLVLYDFFEHLIYLI
jgi:hypothetical protein